MTLRADFVTVYHNDTTFELHKQLRAALLQHEPAGGYTFIGVDNRRNNRGFAAGCNQGAFVGDATAPIIGFLNPDVRVSGPFLDTVTAALTPPVVITGCRYHKPQHELANWGVRDWVCGAAFFVSRSWFTSVGGFDTQFVWSWEETDLIRQAEAQGKQCRSIFLPIEHDSPKENSQKDARYKQYHFNQGQQRFYRKWAPKVSRNPRRP
jgi:GT2 family glycosyltransferase